MVTTNGQYQLYEYNPSLIAAGAAAGVFGLLTLIHLIYMMRTGTLFNMPFVIGGIFETVGFAARTASHYNRQEKIPYIIQTLLILLAPALFAATIYMTLTRIMIAVRGERYSIIRFQWLTKIFVLGDVVSFFGQCTGGGILASGNGSNQKLGERVIEGSLVLQIVWFGFFMLTTSIFWNRMARDPPRGSKRIPWSRMVVVLLVVSTLILGRSGYRVAEYVMGQDGYLLKHEWTLYTFDAGLMAVLMTVWMIWHPSMIKASHYVDDNDDHHHHHRRRRRRRSTSARSPVGSMRPPPTRQIRNPRAPSNY